MLLVIFGAGASYDSASSYPPQPGDGLVERPPLASQLFEDRPRFAEALRSFPRCQPLIPRLRHPPEGATVEELLQEYRAQAEKYPERHCQLAAIRYYLHYVLWQLGNHWQNTHQGITNYKTLLDDLERWRFESGEKVCLVTFNYDTLLESSLGVLGITISSLGDYVSNPNYKIIKVHGSVNWGHEVETRIEDLATRNVWQIAFDLIERAEELKFGVRYHIATEYPIAWWEAGSERDRFPLFPAIALPVVQKSAFECPDEHLDTLRRSLPEVTRILMIGWRATEEHFLELLRQNLKYPPRMMIVVGKEEEANQIGSDLMRSGIGAGFAVVPGGFTEAIRTRSIDSFLRGS
jgi:hypothetical protein